MTNRRWRHVAAGAALVVASRLGVATMMATPIVQPDEGGFLGIAHYLAFGTGLPTANAAYQPGWSLVLVPFSRVLHEPPLLYRAALLVNVALGLVSFVCLLALVGRLVPGCSAARRTAAATLVAITPAFALSSGLANVSSLFIAAGLLVAVLLARAWEQDRPRNWMLLGLVVGGLVSIHPTAVAVVVGVVIAAGFGLGPSPTRRLVRRLGALGAGLAMTSALSLWLIYRIRNATPAGAGRETATRLGQTTGQISVAVGGHNLFGLVAEVSGQLLYLTASTAGLFLIGLFVGWRVLGRAIRDTEASTATRLRAYAAVVCTATLVASVLVINPPNSSSIERLIYGRYNEHVVALLVLVGLVELIERASTEPVWRFVAAPAMAAVALAGVFAMARWGRPDSQIRERQDVIGLEAPFKLLQSLDRPTIGWVLLLMLACAIGGVVLLATLAARAGTPAALAALGAVSVLSIAGGSVLLVQGGHQRAKERTLVGPIAAAAARAPDDCVSFSPQLAGDFHLATYEYLLPDVTFRSRARTGAAGSCRVAMLVRPDDFVPRDLGLVAVAAENTPGQAGIVLYEASRG